MSRLLPMLTAAALTAVSLVPSSASAFGRLSNESGTLTCESVSTCVSAVVCPELTDCRFADAGPGFCFGDDDVICATGMEPCPFGFSGRPLGGFRVCVPNDETSRLCAGSLGQCFMDPDGAEEVVRLLDGDCDGDGIPNRDEFSGEHCNRAPTLGLIDGSDCRPIDACLDGDCEDGEACMAVAPAGHKYCLVAGDDPEFCCAEDRSCPGVDSCFRPDTVVATACGVTYCTESDPSVRAQCYREPDGDRTIDPDRGDCDGDGTDNLTEANFSPGSECVHADAGVPDGGPADAGSFDAGSADAGGQDAGPGDAGSFDGAPSPDAGSERDVTFGGGGGCVCRAVPGSRSRGGLFVALLAGLVVFCRRYGV